MGVLYDMYPGEGIPGGQITLGRMPTEIFVSDNDEVLCFAGLLVNKEDYYGKTFFGSPYCYEGLHSGEIMKHEEVKGFFRIVDGRIVLDNYVDARLGSHSFKSIDAGVRFSYPDTYYGVMKNYVEDEKLTRAVFGLTCYELEQLLRCYAKTLGEYSDYGQYPRLTRSGRSSNFCDLTDAWILEKFPYIAFAQSGYEFSHISLWGFYRHVQLLAKNSMDSMMSRVLLDAGLDKNILERLFEIGRCCFSNTIVTSSVLK